MIFRSKEGLWVFILYLDLWFSISDGGSPMSSERENCIQAFCKLRRLQEATDNGYCRCISCGATVRWDECDGGHWQSRRYRGTEIEHDNVWPQCKECNRYGGREAYDRYTYALEMKIGDAGLSALETKRDSYVKHDYRKLTGSFLAKCREIRKEKGL
jgi:hypothetical protein